MGSLFQSVGLKPSPEQLEALIQKANANNNGLIEFSEFVSLVAPEKEAETEAEVEIEKRTLYIEEQLCAILQLFDRDANQIKAFEVLTNKRLSYIVKKVI